jgi:hypothetical protein
LVGLDLRTRKAANPSEALLESYTAQDSLAELAELADSAGAEVVGTMIQARDHLDPATLIGSGKVEEVKGWAAQKDADFVLFDQNLSPSQQRNLEKALDCRVLDRTQLILDIFLPTTLLWYSAVQHWFAGQWSLWPVVGLVIALLVDLSPAKGGRRRTRTVE